MVLRSMRDACVMTDVTLGTTVIGELSLPSEHGSPPPLPPPPPSQEPATKVPKLDVGFTKPASSNSNSGTPMAVECNDRCTSPLFPQAMFSPQNGLKFPLANGLAGKEDSENCCANGVGGVMHLVRAARGTKPVHSSDAGAGLGKGRPAPVVQNGDNNVDKTLSSGKGGGAAAAGSSCPQVPRPSSSGGGDAFVVSFPRSLLSEQPPAYTSCFTAASPTGPPSETASSSSSSSLPHLSKRLASLPSSSAPASGYRRRSEVQMLMDGDKPRGQRLSASEVPVFTAEDVSSRTRHSASVTTTTATGAAGSSAGSGGGGGHGSSSGAGGSWSSRGSSTRRPALAAKRPSPLPAATATPTATPTAAAISSPGGSPSRTSPVSGTCVASSSSLSSLGGKSSSVAPATASCSTSEGRKRKHSDVGDPHSCSSSSSLHPPPPSKAARVEGESEGGRTGGKEVGEGEREGVEVEMQPARTNGKDHVVIDLVEDRLSRLQPAKRSPSVFCAEMVVFDSRGDCMLEEGSYSLLMQQCREKVGGAGHAPVPLTLKPLSWSSVFGGERVKVTGCGSGWAYEGGGGEVKLGAFLFLFI